MSANEAAEAMLEEMLERRFRTMRTTEHTLAGEDDEALAEYVRQSNLIESIPETESGPLFTDHLEMAQSVVRMAREDPTRVYGWITDPRIIHKAIMESEPVKYPGEYRQTDVFVGSKANGYRACVSPLTVRERLPELIKDVDAYVWRGKETTDDQCWEWHARFEYIHPFVDGNGRAGRLWMNAIRILTGLPWLTIHADHRAGYYHKLMEYFEGREDYESDLAQVRVERKARGLVDD